MRVQAGVSTLLRIVACGAALPACRTTSSIEQPPLTPSPVPITTIAVTPPSGAFGSAVAERLAKAGMSVTYASGSRALLGTLGLSDSTMLDDTTRTALRQHGITAVLTLFAWYQTGDGKPDSARVRVVSTLTGENVAGVNWANGRGDQGSLQNETMRASASAAALVIGEELRKQLQGASPSKP